MPPDETRKIIAAHLLLTELERDPESFDKWVEENLLTRALAHLVARSGDSAVFLRALASGALRVALEGSAGAALELSAAGRVGVNVRDASTDARTLTIDASGRLGAALYNTSGVGVQTTGAGVLIQTAFGRHAVPDQNGYIVEATQDYADLGGSGPFLIGYIMTEQSTDNDCSVWYSGSQGGHENRMFQGRRDSVIWDVAAEQYLEIDSAGQDALLVWHAWDI